MSRRHAVMLAGLALIWGSSFKLLAWAETRLDSGLAAILQAAAPLFTALISIRFGNDRVTGARLAGVLVGFLGVALLVGAHTGGDLLAALAVIATALMYSVAGVFGAHRLRDVNPFVVGAGSMMMILGGVALGARRRRVAAAA